MSISPGSWRAVPLGDGNFHIIGNEWDDSVAVTCYPVNGTAGAKANANLLAAAPDLMTALQWALDQIDDDLDPDHQAALSAARATLTRVTGA